MKVILVTGLKRSGKNVFTDYILNSKSNYESMSYAEPIKKIGRILFGWDIRHEDGLLKEVIDPNYGFSPRSFYQFFGTEFAQYYLPKQFKEYEKKVGRNIWAKIVNRKLSKIKNNNIIISDWRFPHEASEIEEYNPIKVRVINPNIKNDDLHESEIHIPTMEVDHEVYNNGINLESFYSEIDKIKDF